MSVFVTALADIAGRPLRTLATIVGLIAAISAVVILNAASRLSEAANDQYVAQTYGRIATYSITRFIPEEERGQRPASSSVSQNDIDGFDRLLAALRGNGIDSFSIAFETTFQVQDHGGTFRPVEAMIVSPSFPEVSIITLDAGHFPRQTASAETFHVVVNSDLALQLGYSSNQLIGTGFVGTFEPDTTAPSWSFPVYTLVVDAVGSPLGPTARQVDLLIVSDTDSVGDLPIVPSTVLVAADQSDEAFLSQTVDAVVDPYTGQPMFTVDRVDNATTFATVLKQQSRTALVGSIIALLIGGLGVLGIGIANVRERTSEFGIRSALGASPRHIYACVLCQSIVEAFIAGLIAIVGCALVVAYGARWLVIDSLPLPKSTDLPLGSAVIGLVAALGVGTLAALIPAWRASRISVSAAMRT